SDLPVGPEPPSPSPTQPRHARRKRDAPNARFPPKPSQPDRPAEQPAWDLQLADLRDAHVALAARRLDRDDVADLGSHERLGDRGLRAELARLGVLLGRPDNG